MRISDWSSDVCSSDLIGGEVGVVILPVALHRLLHVHSAGRETARRLARRQRIALADLRGDDGVGRSVRLQPPPQRFDGVGLAMGQKEAARYRTTRPDPSADHVLIGTGRIAGRAPGLRWGGPRGGTEE